MGTDQTARRDDLARARALSRAGRHDEARLLVTPWSTRRGHRRPALLALSAIELAAGDALRALAHADAALARQPNGHTGLIARSRALLALGRPRDALRLLDPSAHEGGDAEAILLARAGIMGETGERLAAIRLLEAEGNAASDRVRRKLERVSARERRDRRRRRLPQAVRLAIREAKTKTDAASMLDGLADAADLYLRETGDTTTLLGTPADAAPDVVHPVRLVQPGAVDRARPVAEQLAAAAALALDLAKLRDFDELDPLLAWLRGSQLRAAMLLADVVEADLAWRHQAYAEAIAFAERARAHGGWDTLDPELAHLRTTVDTIDLRSRMTMEGDANPDRERSGRRALKRELDLLWRSAPEEGLQLARQIALGKRPTQRARVLATMIPLLTGDSETARRHHDGLLLRLRSRGEPVSPELALAGAAIARGREQPDDYHRYLAAFFTGFGLEPPRADGPWLSFDTLDVATPPAKSGEPLVSVIVTAWNAAGTIDTALRSLSRQTHRKLEIIVVDDASTDGTAAVVEAWSARDPRVQLIRAERNGGTYRAKNLALAHASGTYLTNMDADDWSHPRRIERHVTAMERWPHLVATTSGWIRMREDGTPVLRGSTGVFTHRNPGSAFMHRKKTMKKVGFYDGVRIDADLDHWRRMLRAFGPLAVAHLRAPLVIGRWHDRSLTRAGIGAQDEENYSPVRSAYRAAGFTWRRGCDLRDLRFAADQPRRFPAPPEIVD